MFNQKPVLILFLGRNRFALFGANLTGIISLDIPEAVVKDLEVLGKDALYILIKQWVRQYTVTASAMVVVLSEETYFDKVFSTNDHPQVETDVLKFFDTVPFESIWTKVYTVERGKRAIAINKAWYDAVAQGFSLQGFAVKAVIPAFALGSMAAKQMLDGEMANYVFHNYDGLVRQNLLETQEAAPSSVETHVTGAPPSKPKSNLPVLLGIFGVMIVILIVMVMIQFQ